MTNVLLFLRNGFANLVSAVRGTYTAESEEMQQIRRDIMTPRTDAENLLRDRMAVGSDYQRVKGGLRETILAMEECKSDMKGHKRYNDVAEMFNDILQ